jgi:hypothetical protein
VKAVRYRSGWQGARRKIREFILTRRLESNFTKEQILNLYLNEVYLGHHAYGVQAAAENYFRKNVWELTLPEISLVAGLPQAPSELNPFQNPKGALERRNEVLRKMTKLGYISKSRAREAESAPLGVRRGDLYTRIREPFFFDYVNQQLIDKFGVNTVSKGGLKVYTTINPQLQADAQRAVDSCAVCYAGGGPAAALASMPVDGRGPFARPNGVTVPDGRGPIEVALAPSVPSLGSVPDLGGAVPEVGVPGVHLPDVPLPGGHLPNVEVPHVSVPDVRVPRVTVPGVRVDAPNVSTPGGGVDVPAVSTPQVSTPQVSAPSVDVGGLSAPASGGAPQGVGTADVGAPAGGGEVSSGGGVATGGGATGGGEAGGGASVP